MLIKHFLTLNIEIVEGDVRTLNQHLSLHWSSKTNLSPTWKPKWSFSCDSETGHLDQMLRVSFHMRGDEDTEKHIPSYYGFIHLVNLARFSQVLTLLICFVQLNPT